ncbi:glycoprotein-n-acetylgalactosamine 3-beta-galactosyltransferase 1 [Plakobranchus ocellatus]|uniref:Glycoprotein-n-acetylgalactosamine 3-beta-galactosyltransferase 1 n=1 Tax=Plakobranchus ocellatus TaxID=259542 RepID=A0AAV3ZTC9_9GAST|nr:glycoprotein-n-acetylgalactosamine 3-beta-galactosyltransferase 1 [Plakobranchus ocellatus]
MSWNSKSRDSIALVFIGVSVLFLFATVFKARNLLIDRREAETFRSRVRILCWVPSMEKHWFTKLKAVNETWAKRCDKVLYFISSPKNKSHDVVGMYNSVHGVVLRACPMV